MVLQKFDVIIIGAGVVGAAIARELSRYELKVALLEKNPDVSFGTTKANSGVIHAGYDPHPEKIMARLNVKGTALYPNLCEELDVPFKNTGSLVIAFPGEEKALDELLERGKKNGVPGLKIIGKDELLRLEPKINKNASRALYAPTAGIISPYELTIALVENAVMNGVELYLNTETTDIEVKEGKAKAVVTTKGRFYADYIINAAGLFADEISKMAGIDYFKITPRKGEYLLFDKKIKLVSRPCFPIPTEITKGILVNITVEGNPLIGPNAQDVELKDDIATTREGLQEVIKGARKLVPEIPMKYVIRNFAGLRAIPSTGDFIIEAYKEVKGFINVAGICSPGLSAAPAIALELVEILKNEGLKLKEKRDFNPRRKKRIRFRELPDKEKERLIKEDPRYGHIICRCETVTEREVIDAIREGATTVDGIKFRTRAGMGRCQGGFCLPRIILLLARELGIEPVKITKYGGASVITPLRVKEILLQRKA